MRIDGFDVARAARARPLSRRACAPARIRTRTSASPAWSSSCSSTARRSSADSSPPSSGRGGDDRRARHHLVGGRTPARSRASTRAATPPTSPRTASSRTGAGSASPGARCAGAGRSSRRNAHAQDAEMSLAEYEDFVFSACHVHEEIPPRTGARSRARFARGRRARLGARAAHRRAGHRPTPRGRGPHVARRRRAPQHARRRGLHEPGRSPRRRARSATRSRPSTTGARSRTSGCASPRGASSQAEAAGGNDYLAVAARHGRGRPRARRGRVRAQLRDRPLHAQHPLRREDRRDDAPRARLGLPPDRRREHVGPALGHDLRPARGGRGLRRRRARLEGRPLPRRARPSKPSAAPFVADPRVERLADVLVDYSTGVAEGDLVFIDAPAPAAPLVRVLYRRVLEAGGHPQVRDTARRHARGSCSARAATRSSSGSTRATVAEVEQADVRIAVEAETNTRALTRVDPARQVRRARAREPLLTRYLERAAAGELRTRRHALPDPRRRAGRGDVPRRLRGLRLPRRPARPRRPCRARGPRSASGFAGSPTGSPGSGSSASSPKAPTSRSASKAEPGSPATGTRTSPTASCSPRPWRRASRARSASPIRHSFAGRRVSGIELEFESGEVVEARADDGEELPPRDARASTTGPGERASSPSASTTRSRSSPATRSSTRRSAAPSTLRSAPRIRRAAARTSPRSTGTSSATCARAARSTRTASSSTATDASSTARPDRAPRRHAPSARLAPPPRRLPPCCSSEPT